MGPIWMSAHVPRIRGDLSKIEPITHPAGDDDTERPVCDAH